MASPVVLKLSSNTDFSQSGGGVSWYRVLNSDGVQNRENMVVIVNSVRDGSPDFIFVGVAPDFFRGLQQFGHDMFNS